MHIERVTKLINVPSSTRSSTIPRQVMLSLPRIKWLESDPEYLKNNPPFDPVEKRTVERKNGCKIEDTEKSRKTYAYQPLSAREKQIYDMYEVQKMSHRQISSEIGIGMTTSRHYLAIARYKVSFGASV